MASVVPPHTWDQAVDWVRAADLSDPTLQPPAWIVPVNVSLTADPGGTGQSVVTLGAGSYGVACGPGTWPDIEVVNGTAFALGG